MSLWLLRSGMGVHQGSISASCTQGSRPTEGLLRAKPLFAWTIYSKKEVFLGIRRFWFIWLSSSLLYLDIIFPMRHMLEQDLWSNILESESGPTSPFYAKNKQYNMSRPPFMLLLIDAWRDAGGSSRHRNYHLEIIVCAVTIITLCGYLELSA